MKQLAFLATLLAVTSPLLNVSASRADEIAFKDVITDDSVSTGGDPATFGYTFSLANSLNVTQLGYLDAFGGGLFGDVVVTIWDDSGIAQAQATVPGGTNEGEIGGFVYIRLASPVLLQAGTYTIGGYDQGQDPAKYSAPYTPADGITYGEARVGGGNAEPTSDPFDSGPGSYFGPNFQFVVPEPSTWAMLGISAVGAGVVALRRRVQV